MKIYEVRNRGKHDFLKFAVFVVLHLLLLFEEVKLTNHSTYEPGILYVNQFSSEQAKNLFINPIKLVIRRVRRYMPRAVNNIV